jgi:hypothetical protein
MKIKCCEYGPGNQVFTSEFLMAQESGFTVLNSGLGIQISGIRVLDSGLLVILGSGVRFEGPGPRL